MKNGKKILVSLVVISIIMLFLFVSQSNAAAIDPNNYNPGSVSTSEAQSFFDKAGVILGAVRTLGVVISVLVLMFVGIKYMLGSVEERADYKKAMMPYVIGAILLFATTTFVTIIFDWAKDLF